MAVVERYYSSDIDDFDSSNRKAAYIDMKKNIGLNKLTRKIAVESDVLTSMIC